MNIGMLWLDADKNRSFEEKVKRAAEYYRDKYGRFPELCLVSTKTISDQLKVGRVMVQPAKTVMPNYFWLGMDSQS